MQSSIVERYLGMRSAGVPIIVATTPDPFDFISGIIKGVPEYIAAEGSRWSEDRRERELSVGFFGWDAVRGIVCFNDKAKAGMNAFGDRPDALGGKPDIALKKLAGAVRNSVIFMHMKQEFLADPVVRQGIANLRDEYKADRRTLILVGQELQVPFELTGEVLFVDEHLPTREAIGQTICDMLKAVDFDAEESQIAEAVEALCGLTKFQVEQLIAVHIRKTGIQIGQLWEAKKRVIGQTPGLSMFEGEENFDDLVGLEHVKEFLTRLLTGKNKPNAIVFIDELEKSINSNTNDSSGVSLDQLQNVLTEMTDTDAAGMLLLGVPGVGKSAIAKAAGRFAGIPTLKVDFGAAKGSLVGQSEAQIRTALKKIRAISSGRTLWIATCNSIAGLPAELRSRFSFGAFFFDIPGATQRGHLWTMYKRKFGLPAEANPSTKNWTGREIRNCCRLAHDMGVSLKEAKGYIVPVIESAKEKVDAMRSEANGCFLDADQKQKYTIGAASNHSNVREIDVN